MADDIILRWDGNKYIGIDPSDGSQIPLPFDDVEANSLDVSGTTTTTALEADSLSIDSSIKYASNDAELDTVLSNATKGEWIYLGPNTYSTNRTIGQRGLTFVATGTGSSSVELSADWTLAATDIVLDGLAISGSVTVDGGVCVIQNSNHAFTMGGITVNADEFRFVNNRKGDVTFASGTGGGIVDSCSNTTVTDNGSNTVGDIA